MRAERQRHRVHVRRRGELIRSNNRIIYTAPTAAGVRSAP